MSKVKQAAPPVIARSVSDEAISKEENNEQSRRS